MFRWIASPCLVLILLTPVLDAMGDINPIPQIRGRVRQAYFLDRFNLGAVAGYSSEGGTDRTKEMLKQASPFAKRTMLNLIEGGQSVTVREATEKLLKKLGASELMFEITFVLPPPGVESFEHEDVYASKGRGYDWETHRFRHEMALTVRVKRGLSGSESAVISLPDIGIAPVWMADETKQPRTPFEDSSEILKLVRAAEIALVPAKADIDEELVRQLR